MSRGSKRECGLGKTRKSSMDCGVGCVVCYFVKV